MPGGKEVSMPWKVVRVGQRGTYDLMWGFKTKDEATWAKNDFIKFASVGPENYHVVEETEGERKTTRHEDLGEVLKIKLE